jgi:vacuolar-type H+-ATPase subunit H
VYTEAPYELSSYDAYITFKLLADAVVDENIYDTTNKWLTLYLGKRYDYPNPRDCCLDALLKCIDEELVQQHRRLLQRYSKLEDALENEPTAIGMVHAAQLQAEAIICQAEKRRDEIIAQANVLKQEGDRLRREAEQAARKMYDAAEGAERQRTQQAQEQADGIIADCKRQAEELLARTKTHAQEIKQNALDEKYTICNESLKTGMDLVVQQFIQTQEAMRDLEAQFAQSQLLRIFDTFYSLNELIDMNKKSLQTLPNEYSYICENMDTFLEVIQEGLTDFGIQTVISKPHCPFNGKLHGVQGSAMFDPSTAMIKCSLRPGFINRATGNVLQKELVELVCS